MSLDVLFASVRKRKLAAWLVAGLFATSSPLAANPIPGLFNTGLNPQGGLLPSGSADPHYALIQSADPSFPGPTAFVVNDSGFPIPPWLANGPNSKWIAPQSNESSGNSPGDYIYRLTFDLTGLDPATASISGLWTSDNSGTGILLNGIAVAVGNDGQFQNLANSFVINSGFVDGTNTLDFVVDNATTSGSPTGLRVEVSGSAAPLPPPGTPPSIITPPASRTNSLGESATFTVSASGSRPLAYQWRRNASPIPNATNSVFLISTVANQNAGSYDVIVSNPWGTVTSTPPAILTVIYPGPQQLTYEPPGPSSRRTGLSITEIMYHPISRPDGRNTEFLELYNSNPFSEDISGFRITGDWDYTFPSNTSLPGLGYLAVAPSPADITFVYGISNVVGGFTNILPNDTGTLQLRKCSGGVVLDITYLDKPPWPIAADGAGHSLVLARPSYGAASPRSWAASALIGGSPGSADPIPNSALENVVINEFLAHTDLPEVDYIELYNHSTVPVDISGCILTDDASTNKFVVTSGVTIPPQGFVYYTENVLNFALNAAGESLYFKNPQATRIIDAVRYEAQENGVSTGRFPDGAEQFYRLTAKTPGNPNSLIKVSQVVLNELMYHPISEDDDDQFVELYNRGNTSVNLGGWRLSEAIDYEFPSNTLLAPDSYLVVAKNLSRLLANYPNLNSNNTRGNFKGKLAHNGERLVLSFPDTITSTNSTALVTTNTIHIPVDEVNYGIGGRWGQWADGGGSSLELLDPRSNHRLAANWADSDESTKSSWVTIQNTGLLDLGHPSVPAADELQLFLQGPGEALIDDIQSFVPTGPNRVTNSTFEAGISGWVFQGTQRPSSWQNSGGYNSSGALHVRATERGNQAADRIRTYLNPAFSPGQTATIQAKARWLRGSPDVLFRFRGGFLEATGRLAVPFNLGTPGARNSTARANAGPAIYDVSHRPILPQANQPFRVMARAEAPDGIQSIVCNYRRDPATNFSAIPMLDDGLNGDAIAGDGIYTALIPGQSAGTLLAFQIVATDNSPQPVTTHFPADAPARECLVRVGESTPPGAFGTYRFWLTQASFNAWSNREKLSNENLDATFVYGTNRVIYNIGARYSGSPYTSPGYTTPTGALCGYALDFPTDDPLLGETRVILDWPIRDNTDQREQLMFWFLEQFGLPNNYRRYINLFVNGTKRGTIYDDVQKPGADPVKEWFPDDSDGTLYKSDVWDEFDDTGARIGSLILLNSLENFTTAGGQKKIARYRWNWEPRPPNDFGPLFTLVDAINAPASAYQPVVEGLVDVEAWMKTFCMNDLASYWDAFGNPNAKNTFLYKPKNSGWKLMCWDFDVGLGVLNDPVDAPLFPSLNDPAMNRFEAFPAFARIYWSALDEALNTFYQLGPGTALYALLDAKYAAFQANGIPLSAPDSIKSWLSQRRSFLQTQLATVSASFTVNGPNTITTSQNSLVLSGTAPVNIRTITVNGVAYQVTWVDVTSWRIVVPLTNGAQVLQIQGLNHLGQPVSGANSNLIVNYTGPNELPENSVVFNELMWLPNQEDAEYIELFNRSTNFSFDISGWRLKGADFTFPPGSLITNQQLLVLAQNRTAFGNAYGWGIPVAGEFDGQLKAAGETLTLLRPPATNSTNEIEVAKIRYEPSAPWPSGANNTGSSFQLIDSAQDNWRLGNWSVVPTNAINSPAPQWTYFSTNGTASSSTLYIYLQSAGDIYVDDLNLVAGIVPDAGANLIANPGFESPLAGIWNTTPNFSSTVAATDVPHTGSYSLHVLASAAGTGNGNAIYQTISPALTLNQPYSVSFWYLTSTNGGPLTVRLSGSGITSGSINPAPRTNSASLSLTPGTPNSVRTNLPPFAPLWLNELQAENLTGITNRAGQRTAWCELFNPTTNTIALTNLFLSDNYTNLTKWPFPAGASIGAHQIKVIFADGQTNLSGLAELHTSFTLRPGSGSLALSRLYNSQPQVLDYLTYSNLAPNHAYGSFPDAQSFARQEFFFATPGSSNSIASPPLTVFINEWMADNTISLADPADNDFEDWFELYNPGTNVIDLSGYFLTDTITNKFQFQIPNNHHYLLAPHGFLLVWADNETNQNNTNRADLHVNFKLDKAGEAIGLFAADGTPLDFVTFGPQASDKSMGRYPDGGNKIYRLTSVSPRTNNIFINSTPILNPVGNQVLTLGQSLSFTASATDIDSRPQSLSYLLGPGAPPNASIDPNSGMFTWTPSSAPSTNLLSIIVNDGPAIEGGLSATQTFQVIVLLPPRFEQFSFVGNQFTFSWQGDPSQTVVIEASANLLNWIPLSTNGPGSTSFTFSDPASANLPQRFYRARLQ